MSQNTKFLFKSFAKFNENTIIGKSYTNLVYPEQNMEDIEQYYIYFKENVCSWQLTTTLTNRKVKDVLYIL